RLRNSDRSWNVIPATSTIAHDIYEYDALGNITKKDDYGDVYTYGNSSRPPPSYAGPHAVVSVTKGSVTRPAYIYDGNGNMVSGDNRSIEFDNLDRATKIISNGYTVHFRHAPDGQRYVQSAVSSSAKTEYYVDKLFEQIESGQSPEQRAYVSDFTVIVAI